GADDTLDGRGGDDTLEGGAGGDLLTGGAGRDRFVFGDEATASGDQITDFVRGTDLIVIDRAGFGLAAGYQPSVVTGADPQATTAGPQFLFETDTGRLWFDADGTGTEQEAGLVVTLTGVTALALSDLLLI
ncbi:M10 family metallopeptidase C-terminal domain-containing protein, partial [Inquilinus limosus]